MSTKQTFLTALDATLNPVASRATNGLTFTPGAIANDVVEVAGVYYQFAADPTTGTPNGSVGTPYLVDVGTTDTISLANLVKAVNATGTAGVTYSEEITAQHSLVEAVSSDGTTLSLRARIANAAGNFLTLSVTGDDGIAADAATFSGGADISASTVTTAVATALETELTTRLCFMGNRVQPAERNIDHCWTALTSAL